MSVCDGPQRVEYYRGVVRKAMSDFNTNMVGSCNTCGGFCVSEEKMLCFGVDSFCRMEFDKACEHQCKLRFCESYKRNQSFGKPIGGLGFLGEKIVVYMNRLKSRQQQRNDYDDMLDNKARSLAFRQIRSTIINAFEIEENNLYMDLIRRAEILRKKNLAYEQKFMKKLGLILKREKEYKTYIGTMYAVFED